MNKWKEMLKGALVGLLCVAAIGASALAGAQNNMRIFSDSGGQFSSMIRPAPTYVNARSLAASTAESVTVPTGGKIALFAANCDFYANPTTTATVPGDVTDGSASELNPAAWYLTGVTTISLISASTCIVTITIYKSTTP